MDMKLTDIQALCEEGIRRDFLDRFGFDDGPVEELDGSAVVLGGTIEGRGAVLKISPAWEKAPQPIIGAEAAQIEAVTAFVHSLAERGLDVARPLASRSGHHAEILHVAPNACLVGTATERVSGELFPDEDLVVFPEAALREWGRVQARLTNLSASHVPAPGLEPILDWSCDEYLAFEEYLPGPQPKVLAVRDAFLAALSARGREPSEYGLVHGDFHHGNFHWDGSRVTVFDFDNVHYSWFDSEPAVSLYNCLPVPKSKVEERREYALGFLRAYLAGYRSERPFGRDEVLRLPFWLKYIELLSYCYCLKYYTPPISDRRQATLDDYRRRLEEGTPVVEFRPGDLEAL
jgi:Ser/Thr protein kinase RdoA (MazF antagonist)